MADPRFFTPPAPLSLAELARLTGARMERAGKPVTAQEEARRFADVAPLDQATGQHLGFLDNVKYLDAFRRSQAGACFVRPKFAARAPESMLLLVTEEPYFAYALAARAFYPEDAFTPFVSPRAEIDSTATFGADCRIEAGAWIGPNVKIGNHCHIGPNAVIHSGVEIGDHTRIGANATLSHCLVGRRVIIHPGAHLGQDGFGFAGGSKGVAKVPQLGRVIVEDDVEIGAGTCIDRGSGPDTVLRMGSKLDNLVQVGHNVQIGRFAMIAAQVGISGSTHIGDFVQMGGQVGLAGHLEIGAGSKLAAQSGIVQNIPPGGTYGGTPAVPIKEWHRQSITLSRLTKKQEPSND